MIDPATDIRCASGPHVFVEDVAAPVLEEHDRHHLARSLRLRDGDPLTLSDGAGRWVSARFGDSVSVEGETHFVAPPRWEIALVVALAKGTKPELTVQKATEIGVDHVILVATARSIVHWDDAKQRRNLDRLDRVANEASMQSRRVRLPQISYAGSLASAQSMCGDVVVHRADFDGEPISGGVRAVAIGPEGGWTDSERRALPMSVDLGPTVLRAETAAIVAAHQMSNIRHRVTED